jgi:hypothetical protein
MHEFDLIDFLETNFNGAETDTLNYVYVPSPSPILLQAHVDTVNLKRKKTKFPDIVSFGNLVTCTNQPLGADDRAGVYAMIRLHKESIDRGIVPPAMLFTNFEESGSDGMKAFVGAYKKEDFSHMKLMVAMDRRGCGHYVTYKTLHENVQNYMASFGFVKESGSFSDCSIFTENFHLPSVNVAIGYHGEHAIGEMLHLDELEMAINRVMNIIRSPIQERYDYKPYVPPVYSSPKWKDKTTVRWINGKWFMDEDVDSTTFQGKVKEGAVGYDSWAEANAARAEKDAKKAEDELFEDMYGMYGGPPYDAEAARKKMDDLNDKAAALLEKEKEKEAAKGVNKDASYYATTYSNVAIPDERSTFQITEGNMPHRCCDTCGDYFELLYCVRECHSRESYVVCGNCFAVYGKYLEITGNISFERRSLGEDLRCVQDNKGSEKRKDKKRKSKKYGPRQSSKIPPHLVSDR